MAKETKSTDKTLGKRQQSFRQRKADAGEAEIRGIYAPKKRHAEIKEMVREYIKEKS